MEDKMLIRHYIGHFYSGVSTFLVAFDCCEYDSYHYMYERIEEIKAQNKCRCALYEVVYIRDHLWLEPVLDGKAQS